MPSLEEAGAAGPRAPGGHHARQHTSAAQHHCKGLRGSLQLKQVCFTPPGLSPKQGISGLMQDWMALGEVTKALLSRTGKEHPSPVPVPVWSLGAMRHLPRTTLCG